MGFSKSNRIIILLAIDSAFFLLELVVGECVSAHDRVVRVAKSSIGYSVHSLALVADSFHMV